MTPHTCPVCQGRQRVPASLYGLPMSTAVPSDVPCRSCGGTGVLWEPVNQPHVRLDVPHLPYTLTVCRGMPEHTWVVVPVRAQGSGQTEPEDT